ncbi:phage tail tube protein [Escherichia coli]|nr:phage tail tube protein [Escherichia coli]MDS1653941.1 phage tail tube protein [Escherichia coli]
MTTPNPLAKTKGAGTTFWMYTGKGDAFANPLSDTDWLRLAMVKDLQPGEMTADAEDDTYLDDEDADWKTTTQGQKSVGDTSATLAWCPGDSGQKKLVQLFDSGEVCAFRIKYPNGTVDVFRGWLSSLGKTIASKDVMTRTVKISGVGRPYLAEEGSETVGVTGLTVAPASASVNVGAFSLTPDGRLTAKNADISGNVNANSGTLNNVTINQNCQILGKLSANQIEGDIVKTVGKAFPRNGSYASGTITVTVYDDQAFDRQIVVPPVLFRGGKHENFNSNNQQSYWYSTCKLQVLKNGQEIFQQPTTDVSRVFSSVIDMPAGHGHVTLTFNVSSYGANNWTPTTSISDLLVVVMKKSTAGISIS